MIKKIKKYMVHVTRYLSQNPKFIKDFKFWLMREKKKTVKNNFDGAYVSKFSCWESTLNLERTIIFYEWSNLHGTKKFFNKIKTFYEFLDESKIKIPEYNMRKIIEGNEITYFTCIPNKAELIVSTSYKGLSEALDKLSKN